jgi:hypothetical protein
MGVNWSGEEVLSDSDYSEVSVKIYPNPVSDTLNITGVNTTAEFSLYDTNGKRLFVSKIDSNTNTIDVSELSGVYFVHIVTKNTSISKVIMVK